MPSDQALERVSRVLDMIPLLTTKEMSISELALALDTSPEIIERDLEIAFMCGLPGYTPDLLIDLRFEDGYVSVQEPQSLRDPRKLTDQEFNALRLGLAILRPALEASPSLQKALNSLLMKMNDVSTLPIDGASSSHLTTRGWEVVERALLLHRRIRFNYVDALGHATQSRLLSPWRLSWLGGRVILSGFDHQRNEVRSFFLARMTDVGLTNEEITLDPDSRASSQQSHNESLEPLEPLEATVQFRDAPLWWRRRYSSYITDVHEEQGSVTISLRYWSRDWLVMAISSIADRFSSLQDPTWSEADFRERLRSHLAPSQEPSDG